MAQSEHLPIDKASYDLCLYLEQVVARFSRTHRYSLGAELPDGARRVLRLVVRANSRSDKTSDREGGTVRTASQLLSAQELRASTRFLR